MNPNSPTRPQAGHLLILSGPPGCGKTQAVRLLAEELGYDISEWIPPASVSWKESRYIAGVRGAPHRSSLQHLEDFIVHAVRLPMLSLSVSASATPHSSSRPEPCRPKVKSPNLKSGILDLPSMLEHPSSRYSPVVSL